jgi:hypothetical protein
MNKIVKKIVGLRENAVLQITNTTIDEHELQLVAVSRGLVEPARNTRHYPQPIGTDIHDLHEWSKCVTKWYN